MKAKIKKESEVNQCPTCGEMFKSVTAFDAHRTGRFGVDRRCRTKDEMLARGMAQNRSNQWILKSNEYHQAV